MLDRKTAVLACAIVAAAGSMSAADITVDGKITAGDNYGAPKWVQTVPCSATVGFGDNIAGAGDLGASSVGDPSTVNTGVELAIPYSALGIANAPFNAGNPFPVIRMMAVLGNNGGDNLSNQMLPGLALNSGNLGNARTTNFTTIAGDQFISFATVTAVTTAPTVDGSRVTAGDSYGAATGTRLQTNSTGYGDAGHGQLVFANGFGPEGSEIDALHVRRHDASNTLYVMIPGNLEANGNRITVFFDTVTGGQNRILNTANFYLAGMGDDLSGNGLTFDAAFSPDYVLSVNASRTEQPEGTPLANDQYRIYVDYSQLVDGIGATNVYCGETVYSTVAGFAGGALTGGDLGAPAIRAAVDNSNAAGVVGGIVGSDFRAPHPDYAYGDEINSVYAKVENGTLFFLVTGNVGTNFSKLNLFLDCQDGGQNRLRGNTVGAQNYAGNPDIDYNGLNRMGADTLVTNELGEAAPGNGLTFDQDFAADYWMVCTNGPRATSRTPQEVYANAAVLRTSGERLDFNNRAQDYGAYDGGRKYPGNFPMDFDGPQFDAWASNAHIYCNYAPRIAADRAALGQQPTPFLIKMAIDNSNVAGVTTTDASGAAAVTTGTEFAIALSELIDGWQPGNPVPVIRLAGFISNEGPAANGDRYNYVANQVIGGLPLNAGVAADLGDPRAIDLSAIAGNQYVTLTTTAPMQCGPADVGTAGGEPGSDMLLDNNDFIAFINYFFAQDPIADMGVAGGEAGSDGLFDNNDFIAFITHFFAGCP